MKKKYTVLINAWCPVGTETFGGGEVVDLTDEEYFERMHLVEPVVKAVKP
jgi:hypothetical protein